MVKIYVMNTTQLNDEEYYGECIRKLPAVRRQKVDNARTMEDKKRAVAAGMVLCEGLRQLDIDPLQVSFCVGDNGKPYLGGYDKVQFNVSHSGCYAVAAFSSMAVGIDIEHKTRNGIHIAEHFFTKKEASAIHACIDKRDAQDLFLRYWTLKESFMKVTGFGSRLAMNAFEFELKDDVKVHWGEERDKYYFKEVVIPMEHDIMNQNNDTEETYRLAVCAMEHEFASELIWMNR